MLRNKLLIIVCMMIVLIGSTACKKEDAYVGERIRDVDYTITQIDEVPEILIEQILTSKEEPFKLSLIDGNYVYIAIGYGIQDTHGYSISVLDLYETGEYLVVETKLIGPGAQEKVIPEKDFPFIIIKAESSDLPICYR